MASEQEQMQFPGFFGIFKESFKLIISWRKIFAKITLTLILPLTFFLLAQIQTFNSLLQDMQRDLDESTPGSKKYNQLSQTFSSEKITFAIIMTAFHMINLMIFLLSTVAVVYTVASVYTRRDLTFKKVMSVIPKVCINLMVTFGCIHVVFFIYVIAVAVALLYSELLPDNVFIDVLFYVVLIIVVMVFVFMTVICQLASVVVVLESSCGCKAMIKSMNLIKGNQVVAISIFFMLNMSFVLVLILFELLVVQGDSLMSWKRVGFGVLGSLLLLVFFLFGLVIQTMLYLVCKSHHHENIDKGDLPNKC